jgi:membrane protease YdiL (CAAX protease family)
LNQLFMALAGYLQLRSVSAGWAEAQRAAAQAPLNLALVQAASVGLVFIVAFPHKRREGGFLEAVHVRPMVGGLVALCFVAGVFMQMPLAEVGNLGQELWPASFDELAYRHGFVNPTTWWGGISALVALVLVAPVTEELLFRGWLLPDLQDEYGRTAALAWSSMLFGLVHLGGGISAVIYATLAGAVLGAIALRTGSTLASIATHAGVNAVPLLVPVRLIRIEGFNTLSQKVDHISPWLVLASIAGMATALWLIWRATDDSADA